MTEAPVPPVLAIDAGNTRVKWGLREGDAWMARGALATAQARHLDHDWPAMPAGAPMPHAWSWKSDDGHDMVLRMFGGGPRKLGVEYREIGEQLADHFKLAGKSGVLVSSVDADGPAGKAGIKAGDVILKLDGKAIEDGSDLREAVSEAEGGKEVVVTVQRDGRPLDLKVTLAAPEKRVIRRAPGVSL